MHLQTLTLEIDIANEEGNVEFREVMPAEIHFRAEALRPGASVNREPILVVP